LRPSAVPSTSRTPYSGIATDKRTVKDKANHAVVLDKQTADKLNKDVQSYRLITVATLVDRLKINGSLAREALADLEEKGQIKKVVGHSKLSIYSTSKLEPSSFRFTWLEKSEVENVGHRLTSLQHEQSAPKPKRLEMTRQER
jgi:small subunit ribosomal protein S25e